MGTTYKKSSWVLAILFCLSLIVSPFVQITGLEEVRSTENKNKAPFPKYKNLVNFITNYDTYYKENFGFRSVLFKKYSDFKVKVLGESPLPALAAVGKNNWLFLGVDEQEIHNISLPVYRYTEQGLDSLFTMLKGYSDFAEKNGAKYYLCVVPDKETIYPEYLPYKTCPEKTKLTQLRNRMKSNSSGIRFIDIQETMLKAKRQQLLFYKTDTHWNNFGAFIGYTKVMEEMKKDFPEIEDRKLEDYEVINDYKSRVMDISMMIDQSFMDTTVTMKAKFPKTHVRNRTKVWSIPEKYPSDPNLYEVRFSNPGKKHKILVFRDSFGVSFFPYISSTFGESVSCWSTNYDRQIVEREKPDIVLHFVAERNMRTLIKEASK